MLEIDGWLLSCWWQTARKRGSIQEKKNHAKMVCLVGENEEGR